MGKLVLVINAMIWWMALLETDINGKLYGNDRVPSNF